MKPDDRILVEAFGRRRDEDSFRRLYRRHTPMLFGFALRLCGSRAEAEELTQESWVRAIEQHDRFRGTSKYSSWVAGILLNCFRESARRHAGRSVPHTDDVENAASASIAAFPAGERFAADPIDLERALPLLPEGFREVVLLHDLYGYTHREIADMLQIQEGTSKSQLMRGRGRLRELISTHIQLRNSRKQRGPS